MWEEITEETKYINYWLKITETDLLTQEETESYYFNESPDVEPNTFINKDCNGEVDVEVWLPTTKEDFESVISERLRAVTYLPSTQEEDQIMKVWTYYFTERDGEIVTQKRVEGICTECKFFKKNVEDALRRELEKEASDSAIDDELDDTASDSTDTPDDTASEPSTTSDDDDTTDMDGGTDPDTTDTDTGNEEEPSEEEPVDDRPQKTEEYYFIPHGPYRMHRCDFFNCLSVIKNGCCTKYKVQNHITGQEMDSPCITYNKYGECSGYELYEPEEDVPVESPADTPSDTPSDIPSDTPPSGNTGGDDSGSTPDDGTGDDTNP